LLPPSLLLLFPIAFPFEFEGRSLDDGAPGELLPLAGSFLPSPVEEFGGGGVGEEGGGSGEESTSPPPPV
jgi:hypothetical protein